MSNGEIIALNEIIIQQQEHMRKLDTRIKVLESIAEAASNLNEIDGTRSTYTVEGKQYEALQAALAAFKGE